METIGFFNLMQALWPARLGQVAAGATTTSIPTAGKRYVPSAWKGGYMYFVTGDAQGQFARITDNTETTFTVTNLTVAPGQGDVFVLYLEAEVTVTVTAPENVAQWGGVAVTPRDVSQDLAKLDIALSALRDAITAPSPDNKTLDDLYTALAKASQLPTALTAAGNLRISLQETKGRISSAPVTGVKTVTSTPAELFAGASRKTGRCVMLIRNLDSTIRIRVGSSSVTASNGFGIEPLGVLELSFDPASDVPIYAVSEAGNVSVEVFEA